MTLTEIAIKRPSLIVVIFTVLGVLGIFSYSQLKYELWTPDLSGPIEFVWCELAPHHPETELLSHPGEEVILVLSGELDVWIEQTPNRLGENDSITFNSAVPHSVANPGEVTSIHVAAITPPSF